MSSSPHHWFVQTDFGALLGPMPNDALAELARTGALLVRDRVREGTDGEWRLASEVPGLFDEQTPSLGLMSSTLEDLFSPETSAPHELAASQKANRRASAKIEKALVASTANDLEFEIDTPLIAPEKVAEPSPLKYELEFEVDVPLIAPTVVSTPPPIVERRQVPESTPAPIPAVSPRTEPPRVHDSVSPVEPAVVTEPASTPQPIPDWEAPAAFAPRWQPPTARMRSHTPLGKTFLITGVIVSAALLAIVAVWSFWPRQRTDIYASYVAIYKELQQRREATLDQAGWTEFVKRAKPQLEETVPWLEERAQPGDREKSLLLYAGRDLQELLDQPSSSPGPHQKRLGAFFEQLEEMYGAK
ncbi:MAG: hypothetical protein ACKV2Q_35945 [Planctomycetaceae bacterium]